MVRGTLVALVLGLVVCSSAQLQAADKDIVDTAVGAWRNGRQQLRSRLGQTPQKIRSPSFRCAPFSCVRLVVGGGVRSWL
jgi:hypothetical protein